MTTYRFDNRSKDQFAEDIKNCTKIEKFLMGKYVAWLNSLNKGVYTFKDNGVDNSGEFIEDNKDVTTASDFILFKNGKQPKNIEIKFCRPERSRFHLKVNQVKQYIKNDVCIVNWMNIDGDKSRFCIITPKQLKDFSLEIAPIKCWGKEALRINNNKLEWVEVKLDPN